MRDPSLPRVNSKARVKTHKTQEDTGHSVTNLALNSQK